MRILITGASGQLGQSLQDTAPAHVSLIACDSSQLDLSARDTLPGRLREIAPELIINAAAYTAVDKAEAEPERARLINGEAVAALADYCNEAECRLIHVSTDFVFPGNDPLPRQPDDATGPLNVYGASKLAGEQAALQHTAQSRIVRTSWVYSEHGANFVKTMLRLGADRDRLSVVDDQVGSPTYARNLAILIWRLADVWPDQRVLHFCDGGAVSWHGFAEAIFAEAVAMGLLTRAPTVATVSTAEYGAPAPRPAYSVLDTSLTTQLLGIEPQPWRSALQDMLSHLQTSNPS